jgi:uncharacterized membrane protein
MSGLVNAIAAVVLFLGAAVWVGGYVTLIVVTRVADRTLSTDQRVAFFRLLGRVYGSVTTAAFACAVVGGAVLLRDRPWDATLISATAVAAAIVVATAVGVRQARAMTRLRAAAAGDPVMTSGIVARRARSAAALRATIGALTLVLVGLGLALAAAG